MKDFHMELDNCSSQTMAADALAILSAVLKEDVTDREVHSKFVLPEQKAEKESAALEMELLGMGQRIRHGAQLILDKIKATKK